MSEPIQNAAIEDVLSSIRRLVSEDTRKETPDETVRQPEKAPRLVLTPALRVAETGAAETGAEGELSVSEGDDRQGDSSLPEEPVEVSWEPIETPGEQATHGINDGAIQELVDEAFAGIIAEDLTEPQDTSDGAQAPWANPDKTTLFEAAKVEILTNPVHVPEEVAEEEAAEEEAAQVTGAGDAGEHSDFDVADDDAEGRTLASRFAAMEAVIASTPDQWEPDGDVGDDYAGTPTETMDWQDHVEEDAAARAADPAEELVVEAAAEEIAGEGSEFPEQAGEEPLSPEETADRESVFADDTFLDEESLRELVADIVRQELQGALGERITRNVRKLVRREIHRALAAHDLD